MLLHISISSRVIINVMQWAIKFDDDLLLRADEVRNIRADQDLPPELEAVKLAVPYILPKFVFDSGRLVAHFARS
ncbi:MAG TPA: hypothetical protein VIJ06_08370 [Methylovirgula sp.]